MPAFSRAGTGHSPAAGWHPHYSLPACLPPPQYRPAAMRCAATPAASPGMTKLAAGMLMWPAACNTLRLCCFPPAPTLPCTATFHSSCRGSRGHSWRAGAHLHTSISSRPPLLHTALPHRMTLHGRGCLYSGMAALFYHNASEAWRLSILRLMRIASSCAMNCARNLFLNAASVYL